MDRGWFCWFWEVFGGDGVELVWRGLLVGVFLVALFGFCEGWVVSFFGYLVERRFLVIFLDEI